MSAGLHQWKICAAPVARARSRRRSYAPKRGALLGVVLGSLTALTAMGIVLVHRSSRIVNFAQGEIGGLSASEAVARRFRPRSTRGRRACRQPGTTAVTGRGGQRCPRLSRLPEGNTRRHQGFFTIEALRNIAETTIANLDSFERTGRPIHPVPAAATELLQSA